MNHNTEFTRRGKAIPAQKVALDGLGDCLSLDADGDQTGAGVCASLLLRLVEPTSVANITTVTALDILVQ